MNLTASQAMNQTLTRHSNDDFGRAFADWKHRKRFSG